MLRFDSLRAPEAALRRECGGGGLILRLLRYSVVTTASPSPVEQALVR